MDIELARLLANTVKIVGRKTDYRCWSFLDPLDSPRSLPMTLAAKLAIPSATGPLEKSFTADLIAGPILSVLDVVHSIYS